MKKLITLTAILTFACPAMAGFSEGNSRKGGYKSNNTIRSNNITTVAQAKRAHENARFTISGYIVSQIDDDDFMFKDSTGTIRIEVEDGAWRGINVGPKDRVTISGKVDVDDDSGRRSLDVYRISR